MRAQVAASAAFVPGTAHCAPCAGDSGLERSRGRDVVVIIFSFETSTRCLEFISE